MQKFWPCFPPLFFGKTHLVFRREKPTACDSSGNSQRVPLPVHCDGESMGETDRLLLRVSGKQIPVLLR